MRFAGAVALVLAVGSATGCATAMRSRPQGQNSAWICHGGRNAKWQRVSSAAAGAHRRHGDVVTGAPQPAGKRCR